MATQRQRRNSPNSDFKHRTSTTQLDSLLQCQLIFDALHRGLDAGMTPATSIAIVTDKMAASASKIIVRELESGRSVTDTFTKLRLGNHFDHSLLIIGENSGQLAKTAKFIAERYARIIEQKRHLRAKLRMPMVVGFLAVVVLPLPDFVSGALTPSRYFVAVLISVLLFIVTWKLLRRIFLTYNAALDSYPAHMFVGIPLVDSLLTEYSRANFIERLYLLFASGYPILEAVELSHSSLVGFARRLRYRDIASDLHQGYSLADTFEHHEILSPIQLPILATGDAAGKLESSLGQIAEESRAVFDRRIEGFVTWFPRAVYAALTLVIALKIL